MSTSPYALDLRHKVISFLKKGHTQSTCADTFELNLSTVSRWWRRYQQEGHVNPRSRPGRHARVNPEALSQYVNRFPDSTLKEIGTHFGVSESAIFRRLRKLGFSYKKKRSPTWKLMKENDKPIKT